MGNYSIPPGNVSLQTVQDNLDTVYNWLNFDQHLYNISNTNYHLPLQQAAAWFANPVYSPHPNNRVIIFISDGQPNTPSSSPSEYQNDLNLLLSQKVRIYGVFLGTGQPGAALTNLSTATGGYTVLVPPNNTDTLKTVVRNFVKSITVYLFDTLTVSANGVTASAIGATKRTNPPDSFDGWQLQLNKVLPLYQGNNTVSVRSLFNSGNSTKQVNYNFTIFVDPNRAPEPSCYFCYHSTILEILNAATNAPIDTLVPANTSFKLRLSYFGSDSATLNNLTVTVRTNKGDLELVQLPRVNNQGVAAIFEKTVGFAILSASVSPTNNNGSVESSAMDIVRARWVHPYDTADYATDSAFVNAGPDSLRVYFAAGNPASLTPYKIRPQIDTVIAGQATQLWVKVFNSGAWLADYENNPALAGGFSWTIVHGNSGGSAAAIAQLSAASGNHVTLTPVRAYDSVDVTVTLATGVRTLSSSMRFYILPGAPDHLVIEASPGSPINNPNSDAPVGGNNTITIGPAQTSANVYAVIRDKNQNWIKNSTSTLWDTLSGGIVTAAVGVAAQGQGVIAKLGPVGSAQVRATALDYAVTLPNLKLLDTVTAIVNNITYDSLRIMVNDNGYKKIADLTMTMATDTQLFVQGLRTDRLGGNGGWVDVPANWALSSSLKVDNPSVPTGAQSVWTFSPSDTGSGAITVSLTQTPAIPSFSITVHIITGPPNTLVLYPKEGAPGGSNVALPSDTTIAAGSAFPIVAKIFDSQKMWLSLYESVDSLKRLITWSVSDTSVGKLNAGSGDKVVFVGTKAYDSVFVIARYAKGQVSFSDTFHLTIVPGPVDHLVIEATRDRGVSPNHDNRLGTISLGSTTVKVSVYAILRDKYGNWVGCSDSTDYVSRDTTIANAAGGEPSIGEGIISRVDTGSTYVMATNLRTAQYPGLTLRDSVLAVISNIFYLELRIVIGSANTIIDSLTMNTDQDTLLKVQGMRSDNRQWEDVRANWASIDLASATAAPAQSHSWDVSPTVPDTNGKIFVSLPGGLTTPDTVTVNVAPAPPSRVQILIVTPPDSLIVGDTIVSVVKIFNKDGLVPGQYCDSTAYLNALGGLPGHSPIVITDTATAMGKSQHECFTNGVDTVKYVLYRAPYGADSLDKITVVMHGGLNAVTDPFLMHPGDLNNIQIQDFTGKNLDTVSLVSPADSKLMIAVGYDKFGNEIGPLANATWATTGTLHGIDRPQGSRIFYQTDQVMHDEAGNITATVINASEVKITGTVAVIIEGPGNTIVSAITRDNDGDGFLDRIDIQLYSPAAIPVKGSEITFTGTYTDPVTGDKVTYTTYLTVDSVVSRNGTGTDSLFSVYLAEPKPGDPGYGYPQTGWTPTIRISGVAAASLSRTCSDGAGPVVWSVVKTITNTSDRTTDVVTVTFSEPIMSGSNNFNLLNAPQSILRVWKHTTTPDGLRDTMIEITKEMLDSILKFVQIDPTNTQLSFAMSNGHDLTSRDYIDIVWADSIKRITDNKTPPNSPAENNRKVQVVVKGTPVQEIKVVPNPTGPIFTHEQAGSMNLAYQSQARDWVRRDGAGAVLTFNIAPTIDSAGKPERVTGYLKIYDMIGNIVQNIDSSNSKKGLLPETWSDSSEHPFDIYWNCSNSRGMRVAPGIYRAMLFLKYQGITKPKRYLGTIGVARSR